MPERENSLIVDNFPAGQFSISAPLYVQKLRTSSKKYIPLSCLVERDEQTTRRIKRFHFDAVLDSSCAVFTWIRDEIPCKVEAKG